jgi:hypothetical protein
MIAVDKLEEGRFRTKLNWFGISHFVTRRKQERVPARQALEERTKRRGSRILGVLLIKIEKSSRHDSINTS